MVAVPPTGMSMPANVIGLVPEVTAGTEYRLCVASAYFGLANRTGSGEFVLNIRPAGNDLFVAPELLPPRSQPATFASDMFSFGMVLYDLHALANHPRPSPAAPKPCSFPVPSFPYSTPSTMRPPRARLPSKCG